MGTTIKQSAIAIFCAAFLLQSCSKNQPIINNPFDSDKLLLSKVTGKDTGMAFNYFEFTRDSVNAGNKPVWDYSAVYSYGSEHQPWGEDRPLQKISFVNGGSYSLPVPPGGSWDITYKNSLPYQIIDNSIPGKDQGYWQLYYNDKLQVVKTGFAFSTSAGPTTFEFYGYDDHDNLTDLVYGPAVDTPYYKLIFSYDQRDNLTGWQMLFSNGYANAASSAGMPVFPKTPAGVGLISSPVMAALKRLNIDLGNRKQGSSASGLSFNIPPTRLVGDSNVIYENFITSTITNDGKINPYHQQNRLLYYISSRNYSADITTNFSQLQKSNPVSVQYIVNPDPTVYGPAQPMTSNYTYTYNKWGYPLTTREVTSDPSGFWFGSNISYIQYRQIAYIKNN